MKTMSGSIYTLQFTAVEENGRLRIEMIILLFSCATNKKLIIQANYKFKDEFKHETLKIFQEEHENTT